MKNPKIKIIQNLPEGKPKPTYEVDTNAFPKPIKPISDKPINTKPNLEDNINQQEIDNLVEQYNNLISQKEVYLNQLGNLTTQLNDLVVECDEINAQASQQQQDFISTTNDCSSLSIEIEAVQQQLKLTPLSTVSGCTSNSQYNSLMEYLNELKEKYNKCVAGAQSTNVSHYNTVFITQIYNTNEYEGNVTVIGDDEFNDSDQLIEDCVQ